MTTDDDEPTLDSAIAPAFPTSEREGPKPAAPETAPQPAAPVDPPALRTNPVDPPAPQPSPVEPDEPTAEPSPPTRRIEDGSLVPFIAVLLIAASAMMVMFNIQPTSKRNVNTASRFATVDSLVHRGTYAINKSLYKFTVDKVKIDKNYYSSKPPVLPTLTAGVYWTYHKLTDQNFGRHERSAVFWCTLATGWLSHVVLLLYLLRFARLLFRRDIAVLGTVAVGAFAYLGAGFATRLNNHTVAAAAALVGFYYAYRVTHDEAPKVRHWIFSGLSFGFLPTFDIPSTAISITAFVYLLTANWRRTLLLFVPAALPGLIMHLWIMHSVYGSIIPVQMRGDITKFKGSYWARRGGIDALQEPKHVYLFHMLFGHHGLFVMTPLFVLSLVGWLRGIRNRFPMRREAIAFAGFFLVMLVFYTWRTRNYGGWSVGFRWLIPVMPLLIVFFGVWLETALLRWWKLAIVAVMFSIASYHTQDAISGPFQFSRWHNWLEAKPGRNRTDKLTRARPAPIAKKKKPPRVRRSKPRRPAPPRSRPKPR